MKQGVLILICCSMAAMAQPNTNSAEARAEALLKQMTIEEKIGQIAQVDYLAIKDHLEDLVKYSIGSVLWGGDSEPPKNTPEAWADLCNSIQRFSEKTRLKIPIILGIDAVHGHNNVNGAVVFPHNIGLGATRDPKLVENIARITAEEIKGTGIQWNFAPCVAVARDIRWGRTYESYGEDPSLVKELGAAYVKGMQGGNLSDKASALACVKHYVGDGGTTNGKDQGNTEVDEKTLRSIHLPGYVEAIKAGAKSIMVSFNSWNGQKLHGHKYLLTDILKRELGFKGFLVSDWAAIDQLAGSYKDQIEQSMNAGLDMVMLPDGDGKKNSYSEFIKLLKQLVDEGKVSTGRIDDAVRRILTVKYEMDMFDHRYADQSLTAAIGSKEHRTVAREAVRQSLVLLKNENTILPLSKKLKRIHVAGKGAASIGMQCGGWTITWQGSSEMAITGGTTILEAIKQAVDKNSTITYTEDGSGAAGADVGVIVIGEAPYAEMLGDRPDLTVSKEDATAIQRMKSAGIPVVTILLSGRPMIIDAALAGSNAFIAAWLPGTEGQGVADVVFGDFHPVGKLSHSWPRTMSQVPINIGDKTYDPLFPYGFGLSYSK
jgi:beta-glucosidase